MTEVRVLGVRHHGPGSARSVRAALDAFQPDAVLVEGPVDADPLLPLVADPDLQPPVALLGYAPDAPRVAAFWPFATFSPEWQALRWAREHGAAAGFCDLPAAATLARAASVAATTPDGAEDDGLSDSDPDPGSNPGSGADADPDEAAEPAGDGEPRAADEPGGVGPATPDRMRRDPIAALADAAGYDDPERWWEDLVESRGGDSPFDLLTDAMREVRAALPAPAGAEHDHEDRREAHMRKVLRAALAAGHDRVAVVCGAWHAPALTAPLPPAAADNRLLRGLAKRKTALTWVPWTHGRLAVASGYGAGVTSPGWYHHLFTAPDRPITRWLTAVAGTLRAEDLPVSSAHVIEAVRLADTLAGLRGRPLAGLAEVTEATRAVLCDGDDVVLDLVTRRLVVGEALGGVPDSAPLVPLEADLRATARRLRLPIDAGVSTRDLDLRREIDLGRSRLLHRLLVLDIAWGQPTRSAARNLGTFRETWTLQWQPELAVNFVEASVWGTTVEAAAEARIGDATADGGTTTLADLTAAVEQCLLADLPRALPRLLAALDARAALDQDVAHLMAAVPALVRAVRYGDVRDTDAAALRGVAEALLVRICAGLPAALTALDDDAAALIRDRIDGVHAALGTLGDDTARTRWLATLRPLADRTEVHGLVTGRLVRLLLDTADLDAAAAAQRLSRALSVGVPPAAKAAWVEGFLAGGGMLLVHDATLLGVLDEWLADLDDDDFTAVLPLLRRTFGSFSAPERRALGGRLRHGVTTARAAAAEPPADDVDEARAAAAVATVATLLGLRP